MASFNLMPIKPTHLYQVEDRVGTYSLQPAGDT